MSVDLNGCLSQVIGFTRRECDCLPEVPTDYTVSESGLYLDELPGINSYLLDDQGCSDVWNKMAISYEQAISIFKTDVLREMSKFNRPAFNKFSGTIASKKFTKDFPKTKTYAGLRIFCRDVKDAEFVINSIFTMFNATTTVHLYLYDNRSDDFVADFILDTLANKVKENVLLAAETLALSMDEQEYMVYDLIYETAGLTPKNNAINCGCSGSKWCYNCASPCFSAPGIAKDLWRQYFMVAGIEGDDLTARDTWPTSSLANGLAISGVWDCDFNTLLCSEMSSWATNPQDLTIAHALWYKAGELILQNVLASSQPNPLIMANLEAVEFNRKHYFDRYTTMIEWLGKNLDITRNGCFVCQSKFDLKKVGVKS